MKDKLEPVVFPTVSGLLEKTPEARKDYELRCELLTELRNHIEKSGLTQVEVAKALSLAHSRVTDLMCGRVSTFSVEALLEFIRIFGFHVTLKEGAPSPRAQREGEGAKRLRTP